MDPRLEAKKKLLAELIDLVMQDQASDLKSRHAPPKADATIEVAAPDEDPMASDEDISLLDDGKGPFPDQQGSESPPIDMILEEELGKRKK